MGDERDQDQLIKLYVHFSAKVQSKRDALQHLSDSLWSW